MSYPIMDLDKQWVCEIFGTKYVSLPIGETEEVKERNYNNVMLKDFKERQEK